MNAVRSLPIRVQPIDGEALDSWLETLAHRSHTAFGDLLVAVGLTPVLGMSTSGWIVQLTRDQISLIAAASGVACSRLETMTIDHYAGRAVRINSESGALSRAFPWGRARGSRFCPACLEEAGGRWQLAWRLGWSFACVEHNCLLADACPQCGAVQRLRTHIGDRIPQPGRCAHPATEAVGRTPERCGADLTVLATTSFVVDHPVVQAQKMINTIIDNGGAKFGIYSTMPQPPTSVLADVRAVAGRALAYATAADLESVIPADLLELHRAVAETASLPSGPAGREAKPGLAAPARAVTAAVGVVAALEALGRPDVASGGEALRWLMTSSRERGSAVRATNTAWGQNTSPVLTGVQLAALGPRLNPSDQLRYRIGTLLPAQPVPGAARATMLARRLPSMLWPNWSLRISISNCHQRQLRPALSIILLLVGSRLSLDEAARLIDSPVDGHAVSRVLQLLEKHEQWIGIRAALIQMADYLADDDVPVDYQRRRRLDYSMLLSDEHWAQICRDTATPGPWAVRVRIARCLLFERLCGRPASASPWTQNDSAFRTKIADFPRHLTPGLAQALNEHAQEFLAWQGIDDEPVAWHPPSGVLAGLDLPGTDPDAVDIDNLHRAIAVDGTKLGTAAQTLSISLDAVRYLLEMHPAPRPVPDLATEVATSQNRAYCTAKTLLPREKLAELYEGQRMSLRDIAATIGVSRQIIGRLARDYGLALRQPGLQSRAIVDGDWLYEQYVTNCRSLPDIAEEAGMSTANMARWARRHAIPMRGRGGGIHTPRPSADRTPTKTEGSRIAASTSGCDK